MKFEIKEITFKEKVIKIFIPINVPKQLAAVDPGEWDLAILGNANAFSFLQHMFEIAAYLNNNEILYIPTYKGLEMEYRGIWQYGTFDLDIVLINFHALQISTKQVQKLIQSLKYSKGKMQVIEKNMSVNNPSWWKTDRKLTAKRQGKLFILSTNRDVYKKLQYDIDPFSKETDDENYNFNAHLHEDWIGTQPDNGFNFLYYYRQENKS